METETYKTLICLSFLKNKIKQKTYSDSEHRSTYDDLNLNPYSHTIIFSFHAIKMGSPQNLHLLPIKLECGFSPITRWQRHVRTCQSSPQQTPSILNFALPLCGVFRDRAKANASPRWSGDITPLPPWRLRFTPVTTPCQRLDVCGRPPALTVTVPAAFAWNYVYLNLPNTSKSSHKPRENWGRPDAKFMLMQSRLRWNLEAGNYPRALTQNWNLKPHTHTHTHFTHLAAKTVLIHGQKLFLFFLNRHELNA